MAVDKPNTGLVIGRRLCDFLSKCWFQAVFIALPATVIFGPYALAGFLSGMENVLGLLRGNLTSQASPTLTAWWVRLTGCGGLLGLLGGWFWIIFKNRLLINVTILNWIVCFLLLSGVAASFYLLYLIGISFIFGALVSPLPELIFFIGLLFLGVYGMYLSILVVRPKK